jgi:hypothetical protein
MNSAPANSQNQAQSALVQLNSNGEIQWVQVNPNPIKYHAAELWDTLKERETAIIYKQALHKTWIILKQAIALIFFILLLSTALIIAIWGTGYMLGVALQKWIAEQERQPEDFVTRLLQALRSPIDQLIAWANTYVERYLPWFKSSNKTPSDQPPSDKK